MQFIKAVVTSDPMAPNYGLEMVEYEYHEGWTLRQYIEEHFDQPEQVVVYVNLLPPESWDIVLTPEDGLLIGNEIREGFSLSGAISWIAGAITNWLSGTALGTYMSVAALEAAGYIAAVAVAAGGMLMVNSLLAPESPNRGGHTGADNSKAYQWGQIGNTAQEMIGHPVGMGTFSVRGNLVASRTESYNVEKAGYSIRETLYLLFSCVNNKISALNYVTINGMDASTFADDDISVYYTDGANDQDALDPATASSFLPADPIAPASSGPLFPVLSTETLLNAELEIPDHVVDAVESGSALVGYTHTLTSMFDALELTGGSDAALEVLLRVALTKTETTTIYLQYKTDMSWYSVGLFTGYTTPCFAVITNEAAGNYINTTEYVLISAIADGGITGDYQYLTLTISGTREYPQAWGAGAAVTIIPAYEVNEKTYTVTLSGSDVWDQYHYLATTSWTSYTSSSSAIEDLEMQMVLPRGLFFAFGGTHSGKDAGVKFPRWETYELHVLQLHPSTSAVLKDILFTPPDNGSSLSTIAKLKTATPGMPRAFYSYGSYTHSHTFSIKATDIVAAYADFPSLYSHPDSSTQLALDGDGYLPTGYKYQIKMRIHGHGAEGRKGTLLYSTVGPSDAGGSSDIYETRLYRVRELDYGEILRYPNHVLLAIVLNSTPTTGGQMPNVIANFDFSMKYWNGSAWAEGHTKNPGQLATGICYNALWGAGIGGIESAGGKNAAIAEAVDLVKFAAFAVYCADTTVTTGALAGEPNHIFNGLYDSQRPFWDSLTEVCAVANARPYFDGPKISVYWEKDVVSPVQTFNTVTMKEGTFKESYINTVDTVEAINGSFVDEDTDEKTAINWIFPLGDPLKNVPIELVGITNRHRALRALQYKLNKTNIIKKACSFETWTSALNCEVGDLVIVENEFVKWGTEDAGGFITAVNSGAATVTLDRLFDEPAGTKYLMLRARADDTIQTWTVSSWNNTGSTTVLTLATGVGLTSHAAKDLFVFGVGVDAFGKYTVSTIDIHGDMSVSINAIQYIEQSQLDSGLFTITASTVPGITKENFCPRNITLTPDLAETEVEISWSPPLITEQVVQEVHFDILRYQIWRRRGSQESFELVVETLANPYTDSDLAPGSHYFYKVIPVFNYYGSEAVIPLSWCSNFTDSGNQDVDDGVDFSWSIYEYLPLPELSTHADHPNGYLVNVNAANNTLCDITVYLTDPDNWRYRDSSEGYAFWLRTNDANDVSDWFGPTGITLAAGCSAGASTVTVSSATGLTIPGLIIIDGKDLVYVHSESSNVLTLGHPSYFDADDLTRKFTVGVDHGSGVSVYNAHKGFFPVRYFGFEEDVEVVTSARQLTCDNIHRYNVATGAIVSSSDWSGIVQAGVYNFRPVYSKDNIVGGISQASDDSFVAANLLVPSMGDFTINMAYFDVTGRPNGVYAAVWAPEISGPGEVKIDKHGDLYFTIQGLPQIDNCWFAINRLVFDAPLGLETYGWTSHIQPVGI